jgi:hypothetical protein
MTQENLAEVQQSSVPASESSSSESSYSTSTEKMIPQSKVDEIVKTVKFDADRRFDDYRKQYESSAQNNQRLEQPQFATKDDVARAVQEQLDRLTRQAEAQAQEQHVNGIVNTFKSKMQIGKEKYQDFEDVAKNIEYSTIPNVIERLTAEVDNVADVLYDLAKNRPLQLMELENLAAKQPNLARQALRELSESIKVNDRAKDVKRAQEPLRQITQSNVGIDDGSDPSIGELRKITPWKR